jgi:hypothetical protein
MIIYIILFIILILLSFILIKIANGGNKLANGGNKIKTYKIFYNNEYTRETYSYLINRLNSLGWKEEPHNKKYVNFAFSLLNNNHIAADLKYALNGFKMLVHKDFLFKHVKLQSHIPYTEDLKTYKWCDDVVIVKEVLSEAQKGVYVIVEKEEFLKLKDKLANTRAIVSKYIKNPLLFEGKKFHLRILIIVFVQRENIQHENKLIKKILYIKDNITIKTTKKKYIINSKEDYLDPEINITGGAFTDKLIMFSELKNEYAYEFINKCKKSIDDAVGSISLDNISLYPEQKAGLFIYGADIMLDDTGHAWILELNDRPGLIGKEIKKSKNLDKNKYIKLFYQILFQFILDKIVLPYFSMKDNTKNVKLKNNIEHIKIKTYRLFGDHIYYQYLREQLNKLGWVEKNSDHYVDFAYILPYPCLLTNKSHDRKKFNITNTNLKSTLSNIESLGYKDSLAMLMKGSPYIPYTENIKNYIYSDGDIVIVKKVLSSQQEGIYIVVDKNTFFKLKAKLSNVQAIVSKYIKNPLLFQGKKFHFRIMVSVFVTSSSKKIIYNKDSILIVTAKDKYNISVKEDYLDPDMNLSRGDSTKKMYIWPKDFVEKEETFIKKCNKSIHDAIHSIPLDKLSLYPDQKAGFYTYGADIMLDDTGHAYVLEMNMDPGLGIELLDAVKINKVNKKEIKQNYLKYFKDFKQYVDTVYKFHLDKIILPYFT